MHTLVDDPVLITTMGLAVDRQRRRLLVVNGDVGIGARTTVSTLRKTAGLGIYDLGSGRRCAYHDLGALEPGRDHFGNDVAVAADGSAFVTDSFSGAVYLVPRDGPPGVLFRDDRLLPDGRNGANGIVVHPEGFLLVAHTSRGALYRFADDVLVRVQIDGDIGAPDGLLLDGEFLHVVDNSAANRVLALRSGDNWVTARVVAAHPWPERAPTTMTVTGCGVYVLSGRLDLLAAGSDTFVLRKLPV
ncbi:MAG: hypothetical protein M3422_11240 [Actinomycetota bacterium]|nr:hypothetical protein [Actinomycetota bacterium]